MMNFIEFKTDIADIIFYEFMLNNGYVDWSSDMPACSPRNLKNHFRCFGVGFYA